MDWLGRGCQLAESSASCRLISRDRRKSAVHDQSPTVGVFKNLGPSNGALHPIDTIVKMCNIISGSLSRLMVGRTGPEAI